MAHRAALISVS